MWCCRTGRIPTVRWPCAWRDGSACRLRSWSVDSDVLLLTKDPRRRRRVEAVLRGVDAVVTIGENLRDRVIAMGVPAERVTSVMRPVDVARFAPGDRAEARRRRGLPLDHAVLLWVGRLVPVKGVDTLLRAVAVLREQDPALVLCIAGDGPDALESASAVRTTGHRLVGTLAWQRPPRRPARLVPRRRRHRSSQPLRGRAERPARVDRLRHPVRGQQRRVDFRDRR